MKRAIVTGASGFIGRYLIQELVNNYYEVWAVVRESSDVSGISLLNTHLVYCDMNNIYELLQKIPERKFDIFYHLAWDGNSGDKRKDYVLQLNNAKVCADAAKVAGILGCTRFIGAGSVTELMYRDYLYTDGSKPDMVTCYAVGKLAAEYLTRCVCAENEIEYIWTYISNFYGVGDKTQNFINFLIKSYINGIVPELTEGEQLADFMYVTDVARALVMLGEKGRKGENYYIGYGEPQPLKLFVKIVRDIVNPNICTGLGKKEFRGLNIDFESINYKKLNKDTGFKPKVKFEDGIYMTIKSVNDK